MSTFFYFRKPNRLFVFLSSYHWFGLFVHLSIIGLVINLVLLLPSMLLYSTLYVNVLCFFDSYWHINFVISLINLLVLDSIKCNNLFFFKAKSTKTEGKNNFRSVTRKYANFRVFTSSWYAKYSTVVICCIRLASPK